MGKRLPAHFLDDFANVEATLRPIVAELGGRMPTRRELITRNLASLGHAIGKNGGPRAVAKRLGIGTNGTNMPNGYYDSFENVAATLRPIVAELGGRMPTNRELGDRGHKTLSTVIGKLGGPAAVAKMLEVDTVGIKVPNHHYDDFENVRIVLLPITEELGGKMPRSTHLKKRGLGSVSEAIRRHGGPKAVAAKLCLPTNGVSERKGHFKSFENLAAALRPLIAENGGKMPTTVDLQRRKFHSVTKAIGEYGGPKAVAERMGIPTEGIMVPGGFYDDFANVKAILLPIVNELGGRMPDSKELTRRKLTSLITAIGKHGGPMSVARQLGIDTSGIRFPKGYFDKFENLEMVLRPIVAELGGKMPDHKELIGRKLSGASNAITKYGGLAAVATRLGLDPVTQKAIEDRADRVAPAYLALEHEDDGTALWNAMTTRWLTRDLDAALAEFEKDGSLDAFRRLLADP